MVWVPRVACLGAEGKQGRDLTPQVSPQHLLSAWSVNTYGQGQLTGWGFLLAPVAGHCSHILRCHFPEHEHPGPSREEGQG